MDPTRRKKHQHITDLTDEKAPQSLGNYLASWDTDSGIDADIDSDTAYENEGDLEEARRVPRPLAHRTKQHITEQALPDRPRAGEGTEHTGRELADGEVNGGGNAQQQKNTPRTKEKPVIEEWGFFPPYGEGLANIVRVDGPPRSLHPVTASSPRTAQMPKPGGGMKPVNTLHDKNDRPDTYKNKPKKTFDLRQNVYNTNGNSSAQPGERPLKRQRVEDESKGSAQEVINLVDESPASQSNRSHTVPRSGASQSQLEQQRYASFGTPREYNNVEETVRPKSTRTRRKSSVSSDIPGGRGNGDELLRKQAASKQKVTSTAKKNGSVELSPYEHKDDPIIDDHVEVREARPASKKSRIQVEIPQSRYQGTADPHSARGKQNGNSKASLKASVETEEKSPYFSQSNGNAHKPRKVSTSRPVDEDKVWDDHGLAEMRPPKRTSENKKAKDSAANAHYEDDPSLDDLSSGHYGAAPEDSAQKLLAAQKNSASQQVSSAHVSVDVIAVDESDDELTAQKANIKPTKFAGKKGLDTFGNSHAHDSGADTSSKGEQPEGLRRERYDVFQVFSLTSKWKIDPTTNKWRLIDMLDDKQQQLVLRFFSDGGAFEFDILPSSITRIEFIENSAKMVIHRPADMTSNRQAHQIYLELGDPDQVYSLRTELKRRHPTIGLNNKSASVTGYLDKVFENNRYKRPEPKRSKQLPVEEADDLKHLREKQKRKLKPLFDSAQQSKENDISSSDHAKRTQRAGGLSKRMQISETQDKSLTEISDDEDGLSENFKDPLSISGGEFYGKREADDYSFMEVTHETRSSTRSKKNPSYQPPPKPRSPSPVLGWTQLNPDWGESWHTSVVFAGDGKARATIDKTDIPKLDEGEFLNDSLIYFYLLYLQKKLADAQPDLAKRIFVQNSFFYERLTKQDNQKKGFNYEAVRKWTDRANVDIFEKDYIIVPVNENLHWYVAIICNAPRLLNPEIEIEDTPSQNNTERSEPQVPEDDPTAVSLHPSPLLPVPGIKELSLDDAQSGENGDKLIQDDNSGASPAKQLSLKQSDGPSITNGPTDNNTDDEMELVQSDLIEAPVKAAPKRKGKRQSLPRRYNPKEPRIITLDSFDHPHSPACTNLKKYLIAELRAKHNKDIPPPGDLGMTAKGIPLQDNFSDCGVFLLGYMEKFFRNPDEFARGLLQGQQDLTSGEKNWVKAPEMRKSIRDLLFKLQEEQAPVPAKKKRKRAATLDNTAPPAASSKPPSREASKIARASVSRDDNESNGAQNDLPRSSSKEPLQNHQPSVISEDSSKRGRIETFLPGNSARETSKRAATAVAPEHTFLRKKDVIPDSDAEDTEPKTGQSFSPVTRTPTRNTCPSEVVEGEQPGLLDKATSGILKMLGMDKKEEKSTPSNLGASHSNPLEIDESPRKQDQQTGKFTQDPAAPRLDSVGPEGESWRDTSRRQPTPYPTFLEKTPSPGPSDDSDSGHEIDVSSSAGLNEPILNGSDSRTLQDEEINDNKEVNHEDQEMLFPATTNSSKQRLGSKSNRFLPQPTPRVGSPRKRAHSEAPGPRKKEKREVIPAEKEDESSLEYLRTEKAQQARSRAVSHGVEKPFAFDGADDTSQHTAWTPPLKGNKTWTGTYKKFED